MGVEDESRSRFVAGEQGLQQQGPALNPNITIPVLDTRAAVVTQKALTDLVLDNSEMPLAPVGYLNAEIERAAENMYGNVPFASESAVTREELENGKELTARDYQTAISILDSMPGVVGVFGDDHDEIINGLKNVQNNLKQTRFKKFIHRFEPKKNPVEPVSESPKQIEKRTTLRKRVPKLEKAALFLHNPRKEWDVEPTKEDVELWNSAYVGGEGWKQVYLVSLALKDDQSKKLFAQMYTTIINVEIDIPLVNPATPEELANEATENATFFGMVEPVRLQQFATKEFNRDKLQALINQKVAGGSIEYADEWFGDVFDAMLGNSYGQVHIGSFGGGWGKDRDYRMTIESGEVWQGKIRGRPEGADISLAKAYNFARIVQKSLPHLDVAPVSVESYLQEVQNVLGLAAAPSQA